MHENLGVHGPGKDRALILQLAPELGGVDDVAVVREGNVAVAESCEHGLRILDRGRAGGTVARMPDRHGAAQCRGRIGAKPLGHETHAANSSCLPVLIDGDDARRFLTAMLQRVQTEMYERAGVLHAAHAKYSTHVLGARWLRMLLEHRDLRGGCVHDVRNRVVIRVGETIQRRASRLCADADSEPTLR